MFRILIVVVLLAQCAAPAAAGRMGFGGFLEGGHGGPFGGGFGGPFLRYGLGLVDSIRDAWTGRGPWAEVPQDYFENRFQNLMEDYDEGLMEIEEFFSSDEYTEIVDDLGNLVVRHDFYLDLLGRRVDRLDDVIALANDDLLFYEDLLTEYQERDDLTEQQLMRIENRLSWKIDHLNGRVERLSDKQVDLGELLPTVEMFNDDLSNYLDEIVTAGMTPATTPETSEEIPFTELAALAVTVPDAATLPVLASTASSTGSSVSIVSVPEPHSWHLIAILVTVVLFAGRTRR